MFQSIHKTAVVIGAIAGVSLLAAGNDAVRINQIQVIGTHNSYHAGIAPSETKLLEQTNPRVLHGLDYRHAPLADQLSAGVRQIEIDVFADTQGGRYAHPAGPDWVAQAGLPADPVFDPEGVMKKPGFKVMHVQDVDYRSTCQTFVDCLKTVHDWSQAHPAHVPLFFLIETKQDTPKAKTPLTVAEKFTAATFDALDAEIRSVFKPEDMITPDQVRGSHATLNEAIRTDGWPTLAQARGKVIFLMDQRPMEAVYVEGHPSLRGRVLFTNAEPGQPDAAFTEQNDGSAKTINELVQQGYLVRTRADENTEQARTNDTKRRDEVLASGAQMISTDYPASEPSKWTGYSVGFPGGLSVRCNPVLKPAGCVDAELEKP